jgi:phosphate starvation-inducible membrane PsiE
MRRMRSNAYVLNPGYNLRGWITKQFYWKNDIIKIMAIEKSIKNLLLLVLAIVIVAFLWNTIWFLGGLAVFAIVVYFVYQLLKGNL